MDDKMQHLSTMEVFRDLSERERDELDRITTMSTVRRSKVFYRPEEMGEVLFILKKGIVQLYRISPEGKKLVITTLTKGSLFGEMSLLGQQMHNTFAEATTDCTICVMSRNDLERLILASLLLRLAGDEDRIIGYTHQDLAEMVGTYRETATQVLNDFKGKGLIEIGRKRLMILDREGLLAIAEN